MTCPRSIRGAFAKKKLFVLAIALDPAYCHSVVEPLNSMLVMSTNLTGPPFCSVSSLGRTARPVQYIRPGISSDPEKKFGLLPFLSESDPSAAHAASFSRFSSTLASSCNI